MFSTVVAFYIFFLKSLSQKQKFCKILRFQFPLELNYNVEEGSERPFLDEKKNNQNQCKQSKHYTCRCCKNHVAMVATIAMANTSGDVTCSRSMLASYLKEMKKSNIFDLKF